MTSSPFAQMTHPHDPRVIVANDLESFEGAAQFYHGGFNPSDPSNPGAIIWNRSSAQKEQLRKEFLALFNALENSTWIRAEVAADDVLEMTFPDEIEDLKLDAIKRELETMARTYHRLTGEDDIEIKLLKNLQIQDTHDHDYHVLNCAWSGIGTEWDNAAGEALNVPEGDWLFINEDFEHRSPEATKDRMLVVTLPFFSTAEIF